MKEISSTNDNELHIGEKLDGDGDLEVEMFDWYHATQACVYLPREQVEALRDHLNGVLGE